MQFDPASDNVHYYSDGLIIVDVPELGHPVLFFRKKNVSEQAVDRALGYCSMKLIHPEIEYNGEVCYEVQKTD